VHHIFSPVAGEVIKTVHIPGRLWPVNDWALSNVDRLFAVNERVVTFIDSGDNGYGLVCVVMVGATNVGRIALTYTDVESNLKPWQKRSIRTIEHAPPIFVKAGEKIGTFKMGSSVLVLVEHGSAGGGDGPRVFVDSSRLRKLVFGELL
jgi:phosphatidylserine decarboxylase